MEVLEDQEESGAGLLTKDLDKVTFVSGPLTRGAMLAGLPVFDRPRHIERYGPTVQFEILYGARTRDIDR
jgi:hypothetical protein